MIPYARYHSRTSRQYIIITALSLIFAALFHRCVSTPIDIPKNGISHDGAVKFFSGLEIQLENSLSKLKVYMLSVDVPLAEDVELSFRDEEASYPEVAQKSMSYPEIAAKSDTFWDFD